MTRIRGGSLKERRGLPRFEGPVATIVYDGKCVFFDHVLGGCHLHRLSMEMRLDVHWLKPMVCCLFPLAKGDLRYYFGDAFVDYLERAAEQAVSKRRTDTLLTARTFHAIDVA